MRKAFTFGIGMILLTAPALAFADNAIPLGQTPLQLLTTVAALEAQEAALQNGQSLACAMLFSQPTVQVGRQVALGWGSTGAVEQTTDTLNMRPTNGAFTLLFSQVGTWTYSFKFYDASGRSVTCNADIVVTQ